MKQENMLVQKDNEIEEMKKKIQELTIALETK